MRKEPTKSRVASDSQNPPVTATGKVTLDLATLLALANSRFAVGVRPGVRSAFGVWDEIKAMVLGSIGFWSRVSREGNRLAISL